MTVELFRRECTIVVDTVKVTDLRMSFRVERSLQPTPNKAEVKIWNLNPDNRARLAAKKDAAVQIDAGYEGGASTLFLGNLRTALTTRDGADIITTLSSGDGEKAHQTARVALSVKKDTDTGLVLRELVKALGVDEGNLSAAVSTVQGAGLGKLFSAGTVIHGNAAREMTRITRSVGLTWSVQGGKLQFLGLKQALAGEAILISAETGMVGAPSVDNKGVMKARMLLAPDVFPGRLAVLKGEFLQGQYRIEKTVHAGDTHGSDWFVDVEGRAY